MRLPCILHIEAPFLEKIFVQKVLKFSYIMGGFGKSWRRIDHQKFYPKYEKLHQGINIGCHWECLDSNWCKVNSIQDLKDFLQEIHDACNGRLASTDKNFTRLKETWHPHRVCVYSKVVKKSETVKHFHHDTFKKTPAIGGKNVNDKRPMYVSYVWHRMLPIGNNQYLEIVTIFHHHSKAWKHENKGNQLKNFIIELKDRKFKLTYGNSPN